jgi:hypothetical protein
MPARRELTFARAFSLTNGPASVLRPIDKIK